MAVERALSQVAAADQRAQVDPMEKGAARQRRVYPGSRRGVAPAARRGPVDALSSDASRCILAKIRCISAFRDVATSIGNLAKNAITSVTLTRHGKLHLKEKYKISCCKMKSKWDQRNSCWGVGNLSAYFKPKLKTTGLRQGAWREIIPEFDSKDTEHEN